MEDEASSLEDAQHVAAEVLHTNEAIALLAARQFMQWKLISRPGIITRCSSAS
jgi:hypothetical protein